MRKAEKVATKLEIGSPHPALRFVGFIMNWHSGQPPEDESVLFLKYDLAGSQSEAS